MRASWRLLAACTALSLAACGSPESEPEPAAGPPPAEVPVPSATPAPPPVRPAPPAAADAPTVTLEELAERIRRTSSIGTFTKLSLKNDIDDLLDGIGRHHQRGEGQVRDLRSRFEALTLKVQTLLEDDEPDLAGALARSREEIWRLLADPVAFARLEL